MISVLIASRGRPELCRRVIESIRNTEKHDTEIILGLDSDETYPDFSEYGCRTFIYEDLGASHKWHQLQKEATRDYLMLIGDDSVYLTKHWDEKYISYMPDDGIAAIVHRDDPEKHRGSAGFLVSSRWNKEIGFVPPYFRHFYADTWTAEISTMIDRQIFADDVVIEHRHAKHGKAEWDDTYKRRGAPETSIWKSTQQERIDKANHLRSLLNTKWIK